MLLLRVITRKARIGLLVAFPFIPTIANAQFLSSVPARFSWPIATPCSLKNDYGQYQHPTSSFQYYLHDAVDVFGDTSTYVIAVEGGWVAVCDSSRIGDPLDWKLVVGTSILSDNEGWEYGHLKGDDAFKNRWYKPNEPRLVVNRGDTLGRIRNDHLHLKRAWGYLLNPNQNDARWAWGYPYKNPLDTLDPGGLAQRQPLT